MRNIILIGLAGSGKTSLGAEIAASFGLGFYDMDAEIEKGTSMSISDIFGKYGEPYFRDLEAEEAEKVSSLEKTVISTGGGVVLREENMVKLAKNGFIIFLDRSPELIAEAIDPQNRPLLADGVWRLAEMARQRRPLYEKYAQAALYNDGSFEQALEGLELLINSEYPGGGFGVIGSPIGHTMSPMIHKAAFAELSSQPRINILRQPLNHVNASPGYDEAAHSETSAADHGHVNVPPGYDGVAHPETSAADHGHVNVPSPDSNREPSGNWDYRAIQVEKGRLPDFITAAKASRMRGFNVTIPHKQDIIPYLDEIDEDARLCGAVNTVVIREGRLKGYNTDMEGLLVALREEGFEYRGSRITLLGTGGAAAGILLKAAMEGAAKIHLLGRRSEMAEALKNRVIQAIYSGQNIASGNGGSEIKILEMTPPNLAECMKATDILINATPMGMKGAEAFSDIDFLEFMPKGALVCDLVYNPPLTELLKRAGALGLKGINGLAMLIHQALLADELYLDMKIDKRHMAGMLKNKVLKFK